MQARMFETGELKKIDKVEKGQIGEVYVVAKDIRGQLCEQLKCLDGRLESQQGQLAELQDIFRRRSEIEHNYSRELDRLAKGVTNRHKEHKVKRDNWSTFSSTDVWKQVIQDLKRASKSHASFSELCGSHMVGNFSSISEDMARIYRKCRETVGEIHYEMLKALDELQTAMKTNHTYQSELRQAESKLAVVEKQRIKLKDQLVLEKLVKSRKYKIVGKEVTKRNLKYQEARMKAIRAKNEYLLAMEAANASLHKYFIDDLPDTMDCMDLCFHKSLESTMEAKSTFLEKMRTENLKEVGEMESVLGELDSRLDKKKFLAKHESVFILPKKFEYQPVIQRDEVVLDLVIVEEMKTRKQQLGERIQQLKVQSEEVWSALEGAEKTLVVQASNSSRSEDIQRQAERIEVERLYLEKFRDYILGSNKISRLQARHNNLRLNLAAENETLPRQVVSTRRRIGRSAVSGGSLPKLFGGSLEDYLEAVKQDIPTVVRSCVRVINLHGLHHQGIFRVSGSKVEINGFRESFERGDDPLEDIQDASEINSVAGVLKLYLRELREPAFAVQYFDQFMALAKLESKHEMVLRVREVVNTWPRKVFVVMRYIFSFLNHLSEFSDENMMDPHNLAICFGPTLIQIPPERDQVLHQNLVNTLVKYLIVFTDEIFPNDGMGTVYEKFISIEPELSGAYESEIDGVDAQSEEETDLESDTAEEDILEAQAEYNFTARTSRELSFNKGDNILLSKQVSGDWWEGKINGQEGLVPDKYISLRLRGDEEYALRRRRSTSCQREKPLSHSQEEVGEGSRRRNQQQGQAVPVTKLVLQEEAEELASEQIDSAIANPSIVSSSSNMQNIKEDIIEICSAIDEGLNMIDESSSLPTMSMSSPTLANDSCPGKDGSSGIRDMKRSISVENMPSVSDVQKGIAERTVENKDDSNRSPDDAKDENSDSVCSITSASPRSGEVSSPLSGVVSHGRELWERRASRAREQHDNDYPDLVRDLPTKLEETE